MNIKHIHRSAKQDETIKYVCKHYNDSLILFATNLCKKYNHSTHKADDLVQDAYLWLLGHIEKHGQIDEKEFLKLLRQKIRSNLIDDYRKTRSLNRNNDNFQRLHAIKPYCQIDDNAPAKLWERLLKRALACLTDAFDRKVMELYFREYRIREISQELDRPKTTITPRIYRSLKKIRKHLIKEYPEKRNTKAKSRRRSTKN